MSTILNYSVNWTLLLPAIIVIDPFNTHEYSILEWREEKEEKTPTNDVELKVNWWCIGKKIITMSLFPSAS
jgi:hypothetical protein